MLVWLIGPFLLLVVVMLLAWRRAAHNGARLRQARAQGARSDAALSEAMAEAVTRVRGQELAQRARYEALEAFLQQVVEGVPAGIIVLSRQGHIRLANRWAADWLRLEEPVVGRILWNVAGTTALHDLAVACLDAGTRRDGTAAAPGATDPQFPVTTVPLTTANGEVDGVLCLVHHERVS
jgi:PAS domain-containing protein